MSAQRKHARKVLSADPITTWIVVTIWSLSMIWIAVAGSAQHDYASYLVQWHAVLSQADPWSGDNAYGPAHNILAYLLIFGPLAPKMFIVSALLIGNSLLVRELQKNAGLGRSFGAYLLAVPTNYLVISMAFAYGLNDALVAALVVLAMLARHRSYLTGAGCFLGLAVLLKFYPIVLVPFFALEGRRVRHRLILAAGAVALVGMAGAVLAWSDGPFKALAFAAERGPKMLSILSALGSYPFLVGGQSVLDMLVWANVGFVAAAGALSFLVAWKLSIHWLEASVLGLLATLTTYKVGHQQFYLPWLFLVAALPISGTPSSRRLAALCLPMILFLSAFQWGYAHGSDGYNNVLAFIRRDVGFVAFALSAATIAAYFFGPSVASHHTDNRCLKTVE